METRLIEAPEPPDEPTPQDAESWRTWLEERLGETIDGYRAKPDLLKRDARSEK
jgi:hypothetical protein